MLLFFSTDIIFKTSSQYSVQKKRAESLETLSSVLKEVQPQCYIAISIELFRELAEIHLELMGLNLRRLYAFQPEVNKEDFKPFSQNFNNSLDYTFHKMEAVSDIHKRLYQFSEILGHGALADFESSCEMPSFDSDTNEDLNSNLYEPYRETDMKLF